MNKDLTYINSLGEAFCFGTNVEEKDKTVWHYRDTDLFDFKYSYKSTGGRITSYYLPIVEKEIEIFTHGGSLEERDRLIDVIDYDNAVNERGKLYAGSTYLRCNINGVTDVSNWHYSNGSYSCKVIVTSDMPAWIREHEITLVPVDDDSSVGLNYSHNYPHNYGYDSGSSLIITNPFKRPSKCNIIFPGPCVEPYVIIAGNRYQVLETAQAGSLIIVRAFGSDRPQVVLKSSDGTERTITGKAVMEKGAKIFQKVPVGKVSASWKGGHNVGLVLCDERPSVCWTD